MVKKNYILSMKRSVYKKFGVGLRESLFMFVYLVN
jgi:hypothetical protein